MEVHLLDGTYELFRHFFAVPPHRTADHREVGATRAVLGSALDMLEQGATHLAVATDHVIESWRNDRWPGYKTGAGIDPHLLEQFVPLEEGLEAMGLVVWAMVENEADDALAAGARIAAADPRVNRVLICTPDKDLGQCVGGKIVQFDRRQRKLLDVAGVVEKFGVPPESIPDWLALVGDSADGFPGLPGLGREDGGRGAGSVWPHRGHPRAWRPLGRHPRARCREAGGHAGRPSAPTPCCSGSSRRSSTTASPSRSTTCGGGGRARSSPTWPPASTCPSWPSERRGSAQPGAHEREARQR